MQPHLEQIESAGGAVFGHARRLSRGVALGVAGMLLLSGCALFDTSEENTAALRTVPEETREVLETADEITHSEVTENGTSSSVEVRALAGRNEPNSVICLELLGKLSAVGQGLWVGPNIGSPRGIVAASPEVCALAGTLYVSPEVELRGSEGEWYLVPVRPAESVLSFEEATLPVGRPVSLVASNAEFGHDSAFVRVGASAEGVLLRARCSPEKSTGAWWMHINPGGGVVAYSPLGAPEPGDVPCDGTVHEVAYQSVAAPSYTKRTILDPLGNAGGTTTGVEVAPLARVEGSSYVALRVQVGSVSLSGDDVELPRVELSIP